MSSVVVLAVAVAIPGCGGSYPKATLATPHPVHGKITFPDKTPLRGGIIYFIPYEIDTSAGIRYEAAALIDANGNYKLGYNGDTSGAPAGDYKVTIMPRDYQELPSSNSSKIPKTYHEKSTTPLSKVTVKEGDNEMNFVLQ